MGIFQRTFNPAGGLRYHYRAWRGDWQDFKKELHSWLQQWQPPSSQLLILGASGGYCLESAFLKGFKEIVAIDPDPLAPSFFKRQHPHISIKWNPLPQPETLLLGAQWEKKFQALLKSYPQHALLFSNLLGQLPFLEDSDKNPQKLKRLQELLEDRNWCSYHDRYSGQLRPHLPAGFSFSKDPGEGQLLAQAYPQLKGELRDHLMGQFFAHLPRRYFSWELSPGNFHLVEGIFQTQSRKLNQ